MMCNDISSLEELEKAILERHNTIEFEFTCVVVEDLCKQPNNRLIDKDLKTTLKASPEIKQGFMRLLFKYDFEK